MALKGTLAVKDERRKPTMKNDSRSGMRSSRIVVSYAPLKGVDDVSEFLKDIAKALSERAGCLNVPDDEIAQKLSKTLVHCIELKAREVITPAAVLQIHGIGANAAESKRAVENICAGFVNFLRRALVAMSAVPPPRRGRTRSLGSRDRKIFEAHRSGLSYGKIGKILGMKRHAVQAAYRRETSRRQLLVQNYPQLKEQYKALGIDLREESLRSPSR